MLARIALEKRVSAYIDDGLNRWPAVHRLDGGKLVQLAIDKAPAGAVLHAVAEEGVATRDIAGPHLGSDGQPRVELSCP